MANWKLKALVTVQVLAILVLQYRLWVGDGSVVQGIGLDKAIATQQAENDQLKRRNQLLEADVLALTDGYDALEEKARLDLGMIKNNETFFLLAE